jgi:tetrahydrodipicolinate N-succinyltransferase
MEFLKSNQLELNPAGYLVSKESKKPVNHEAFVKQQRAAEYTVKLAEAIKDKNFTASTPDNLNAIKAQVLASLNQSSKEYVKTPKEPKNKIFDELTQFALDFDKHHEQVEITEQINKLMNQFNTIDDVEQVGDYFTEGVVKLNKIYTIKEILAAVKITVEKIG